MGNKITWKRIIKWWAINLAMLVGLYFTLVLPVEWVSNLVKFVIGLNFAAWSIVLIAGSENRKDLKKKGLPVSASVSGVYALIFIGALVAFGWFGYAGMYVIIIVSQQITYFLDDEGSAVEEK